MFADAAALPPGSWHDVTRFPAMIDQLLARYQVVTAAVRIPAWASSPPPRPERVHVAVWIEVAALDSGSKREYAELMAAADAALYRAEAGGRD